MFTLTFDDTECLQGDKWHGSGFPGSELPVRNGGEPVCLYCEEASEDATAHHVNFPTIFPKISSGQTSYPVKYLISPNPGLLHLIQECLLVL